MAFEQFLDPKNDFAFKKVFGTEKHKNVLLHFLNDVLDHTSIDTITDVQLLKPHQDPAISIYKESIVDVLAQDQQGVQYIIEMQVASTSGFEKRAQYYAAKAYSQQLLKGEGYENLREIIFLAITDFVMFPDKTGYKSDHLILDKQDHSHDLKDFYFTFLELPKFHKCIHELKTMEERWCYFFKHAPYTEPLDRAALVHDMPVLEEAYEALSRASWTRKDLRIYEGEEKRIRDHIAVEAFKIKQAEEQALNRGMEKGRKEGRKEGVEQGKQARDVELARIMQQQGYTPEQIRALLGRV